VDLFSRIVGTSFRADPNNNLGTFKDSKVLSFRLLRDLSELHIEARVRFVGAVVAHCILIRHARNRGKVNSLDSLEQVANETFKQIENIFLRDKGHLAVDLRKLRLTVSAEVFVAKTFYN